MNNFKNAIKDKLALTAITNFNEIYKKWPNEALQKLEPLINASNEICCVSYPYGNLIFGENGFSLPDNSHIKQENITLAFVISGCVEIFDDINGGGYVAYRPIKVIKPGEALGVFGVLDKIFDTRSSQVGERWRLCSGVNSNYCKNAITVTDLQMARKNMGVTKVGNERCHSILSSLATVNRRLKDNDANYYETIVMICNIDHNTITEEPKLFLPLIESGWKACMQYRHSLNAFNYEKLIKYRVYSTTRVDRWRKKGGLKGGKDKAIIRNYAIPEMLYDAIDRPRRHEPVFTSLTTFNNDQLKDMLPIGLLNDFVKHLELETKDILIPALIDEYDLIENNENQKDYYFPVGKQNYFITQWINHLDNAMGAKGHRQEIGLRGSYTSCGTVFNKSTDTIEMIRHCLSDIDDTPQGSAYDPALLNLYSIIHPKGTEKTDIEQLYMCELEESDGGLFCRYKKYIPHK